MRSVAQQHQVAPRLIYDWRKMFREATTGGAGFAVVVVPSEDQSGPWRGRMEVRCGNGRTITVGHDVDVTVLARNSSRRLTDDTDPNRRQGLAGAGQHGHDLMDALRDLAQHS